MYRKSAQFLAILFHLFVMSFVYLWPIPYITLIYFVYTGGLLRYATFAYLIFLYFDWNSPNSGRPHPWCPKALGENSAGYFNGKIISTTDLPFGKNYIVGVHPHGFGCFGGSMLRVKKLYRNIFGQRTMWIGTHYLFFALPFLREYGLMIGFISASFNNLLLKLANSKDAVLVLFPGGALEAINCGRYRHLGENRLTIKRHKGFCKLALMTGSALVPAFTFGELEVFETFKQYRVFKCLQDYFYRFTKFPLMNMASFPRRVNLTLVIGEPIFVDRVDDPSEEEVDKLQGEYIDGICKIYDTYKEKYLENPKVRLIIE